MNELNMLDYTLPIAWIVFSFLAGAVAAHNDRSFFQNFIIAICFSPIVAAIIMIINNQRPLSRYAALETGEFKVCEHCDELVRVKADRCKHCLSDLTALKKIN